jgi:Flagellar biosynthesis protein, FliO
MSRPLHRLLVRLWVSLAIGAPISTHLSFSSEARAEEPDRPLTAAISGPSGEGSYRVPPRSDSGRSAISSNAGAGGWWFGTGGIAFALAVLGAITLASRRYPRSQDSGSLRVIGRAALSSKHSVCLVRANHRIVLIGLGPQGSPTLLGDWSDAEPAPLVADAGGGA